MRKPSLPRAGVFVRCAIRNDGAAARELSRQAPLRAARRTKTGALAAATGHSPRTAPSPSPNRVRPVLPFELPLQGADIGIHLGIVAAHCLNRAHGVDHRRMIPAAEHAAYLW